jgi:ABC-type multidrug transport system fused ATPase/permease subunit
MVNWIKKVKAFLGEKTWKLYWVATLTGVLWFAVEASFILVLQAFLVSIGLIKPEQAVLPGWIPSSVGGAAALIVAFGVVRALVSMAKTYFATSAQISFSCHQRSQLFQYGLREAGKISPKELISIFSEVVTQSGSVINQSALLLNTGIAAILFFVLGFRVAPLEMLIGVSLLGLLMFPLKLFSRRINYSGEQILLEWEKLNESLLRGLKNNFILRIYKLIESEIDKGNQNLSRYRAHYMNFSFIAGISNSFPMFAGVTILSIITFLSVEHFETAPIKLVSFFYIFIRLAQAASDANGTLAVLKVNWPGMKVLYQWHLKILSHADRQAVQPKVALSTEVTIKASDVSFHYTPERPVIKGLDFTLKKGEVLVIKGESGVGKSTLLSLLLGINLPSRGKIQINGYDTDQYSIDFNKTLAYVGPEPYLIEGSLRENLLYGLNPETAISDDQIYEVLSKMELKDITISLPKKLEEHVFEIPQFSTGQKQRLAFARALLRKPSLLVLDEATANLDLETEQRIIGNLKEFLKNCTTVIVTHKNSFDLVATRQLELTSKPSF